MALAILGFFVFELSTVPFQTMQEEKSYRHPTNSVVGARPVAQFTGKDNETITWGGVLYPEITGGRVTLNFLNAMAETGDAYPLILGDGTLKGIYVIEKISTTESAFFRDGSPKKIEFNINLKQVDDLPINPIGLMLKMTINWIKGLF